MDGYMWHMCEMGNMPFGYYILCIVVNIDVDVMNVTRSGIIVIRSMWKNRFSTSILQHHEIWLSP